MEEWETVQQLTSQEENQLMRWTSIICLIKIKANQVRLKHLDKVQLTFQSLVIKPIKHKELKKDKEKQMELEIMVKLMIVILTKILPDKMELGFL